MNIERRGNWRRKLYRCLWLWWVSQSCGLSARDPRGNEQWDWKGKQREVLFFHKKTVKTWSKRMKIVATIIIKKCRRRENRREYERHLVSVNERVSEWVSGGKRMRIPLNKDFTLLIIITFFFTPLYLSFNTIWPEKNAPTPTHISHSHLYLCPAVLRHQWIFH